MPLMMCGGVRASIGVTYFTSAIRSRAALQECIDALRRTVQGIEGEIERLVEARARPLRAGDSADAVNSLPVTTGTDPMAAIEAPRLGS